MVVGQEYTNIQQHDLYAIFFYRSYYEYAVLKYSLSLSHTHTNRLTAIVYGSKAVEISQGCVKILCRCGLSICNTRQKMLFFSS